TSCCQGPPREEEQAALALLFAPLLQPLWCVLTLLIVTVRWRARPAFAAVDLGRKRQAQLRSHRHAARQQPALPPSDGATAPWHQSCASYGYRRQSQQVLSSRQPEVTR